MNRRDADSSINQHTAAQTWREHHQREDGSYDAETWGEVDEDGNRVESAARTEER